MKTLGRYTLSGISLLLICITSVQAAVITTFTTRADFDAAYPGSVMEDWDGIATGTVIPDGSTVSGIEYSSSSGDSLVTSSFLTTTPSNGLGNTTLGFFGAGDTVTFSFTDALAAFAIDINTFAGGDGAYTATTSNGDVIGSFYDAFAGFSTGQFVGFYSDMAFDSVTIAATTGFSYTLDTLRGVVAVPEPSVLLLFILGVFGINILRRRQY